MGVYITGRLQEGRMGFVLLVLFVGISQGGGGGELGMTHY